MVNEPPPDLREQARALCEVLNAYGVTYLVLGNMAARLHGAQVTTVDIDFAPAPSEANLQRLADALNTLRPRWRIDDHVEGPRIDGQLEPRHFLGDPLAVGLSTRLGHLDVVFRIDGFDGNAYEALAPRAVVIDIDDVHITIGALPDLITSKRAARRQKDLEHLPELERLAAARGEQEP